MPDRARPTRLAGRREHVRLRAHRRLRPLRRPGPRTLQTGLAADDHARRHKGRLSFGRDRLPSGQVARGLVLHGRRGERRCGLLAAALAVYA